MSGNRDYTRIVPFRGEYFKLREDRQHLVRNLIYPVPDPAYPFLGVHLTPRIDGETDIGPNAVLALAREGYRRRDVSWAQLSRLARSPAFHRLARRNWRAGVREMRGSSICTSGSTGSPAPSTAAQVGPSRTTCTPAPRRCSRMRRTPAWPGP